MNYKNYKMSENNYKFKIIPKAGIKKLYRTIDVAYAEYLQVVEKWLK